MRYDHTLCWDCAKAARKTCSWSKDFVPVDGWDAEEGNVSYLVRRCPEFVRDAYDCGLKRVKEIEHEQADDHWESDERS